jgi:hypothetical protein
VAKAGKPTSTIDHLAAIQRHKRSQLARMVILSVRSRNPAPRVSLAKMPWEE